MKLPLVLVLLALVVVGTGLFVSDWGQAAEGSSGDLTLEREVAALREQVGELEVLVRDLRQSTSSSELVEAQPRVATVDNDSIDAAVSRWMEANASALGFAAGASNSKVLNASDQGLKEMPLDELITMLTDGMLTDGDEQALWRRLSQVGRFDEVLEELKRRAEAAPFDPDLQVDLAEAYLHKIFEVGNGPLAGKYATLADGAYAEAIKLDPNHLEARLNKAISLSQWPAFMNKRPQAINELEELLTVQAELPVDQQSSFAFLSLGNLYLEMGEKDKAIATWQRGLTTFPDEADLLNQLQLNQ